MLGAGWQGHHFLALRRTGAEGGHRGLGQDVGPAIHHMRRAVAGPKPSAVWAGCSGRDGLWPLLSGEQSMRLLCHPGCVCVGCFDSERRTVRAHAKAGPRRGRLIGLADQDSWRFLSAFLQPSTTQAAAWMAPKRKLPQLAGTDGWVSKAQAKEAYVLTDGDVGSHLTRCRPAHAR